MSHPKPNTCLGCGIAVAGTRCNACENVRRRVERPPVVVGRLLQESPRSRWDVRAKFEARVDSSGGPAACWPWTGDRRGRGYGRLWISGTRVGAHRLAYELASGPIPEGLFVCHTCDNPPCCNPAHLFEGTAQDNARDASAKGRSAFGDRNGARLHPETRRGVRNPAARLTESHVIEIRERLATGESMPSLSLRFDIGASTVFHIKHGHTWKHVVGGIPIDTPLDPSLTAAQVPSGAAVSSRPSGPLQLARAG